MYVGARRRRRTLGDWTTWASLATDPAGFLVDEVSSLYIPGANVFEIPSNVVQNAITGKPTADQLAYNAQQYTDAAANMAQVLTSQGVSLPPALYPPTVAAQAVADQQAYASAIGGTAGQSITTWAWLSLAGIVGLIVLTK
jgi:hypothetical protein